MTPDEVAQFYSWAASADSRLEELDQADLFAWSQILHEVPFADAGALFKRLFSVERKHKLQPGTVLEAWKEYDAEQRRQIAQVKHLSQKYRHPAFQEMRREIAEKHNRIASQLPGHVIDRHGFKPLEVPPPAIESPTASQPMPEKIRHMLAQIGKSAPKPRVDEQAAEKERARALAALQHRITAENRQTA